MTLEEFKTEALKVTLKSVDKLPEDWETFNDKLNTRIIYDDFDARSGIELLEHELLLLDCELEKSYVLITTERVISIIDHVYDDVLIEQIDKVLIDPESKNFKKVDNKYPKEHLIAVKNKAGKKLMFLIDSYYPSAFAINLIYNVLSYKTLGRWYINPK